VYDCTCKCECFTSYARLSLSSFVGSVGRGANEFNGIIDHGRDIAEIHSVLLALGWNIAAPSGRISLTCMAPSATTLSTYATTWHDHDVDIWIHDNVQ
jgi:hypothetical protein